MYSEDSRMTAETHRRRLLLGTSLALAVMLAACLGFSVSDRPPADCTEPWSPSIEANEPTIAPGEHATVRLTITNVTGFSYGPYEDADQVYYDWMNEKSISPSPDFSADGSPGTFYYEECTHVEIRVNVSIPPDTKPGEYRYGVWVIQNRTGKGGTMERTFSIHVSEN